MSMNLKKILPLLIIFALCQNQAYASPWAKKEGYFNKTGGKFVYGLKHSLFSWMSLWTESREPGYKKPWEGFSSGIGKTVVYTAGGLIQLVTFPIPADFPDFGIGMHIPSAECPARHVKDYVPRTKNPLSKKTVKQAAGTPTPALKPLTTPSTAPVEQVPVPIVTEVKKSEPVVTEIIPEEATELEKAQEAELAAQAAAVAQAAEKVLKEKITAVKTAAAPIKETDEKLLQSDEDIVSVTPQTPKQTDDKEDLWDTEDSDQESSVDADLDEDLKSDEEGG